MGVCKLRGPATLLDNAPGFSLRTSGALLERNHTAASSGRGIAGLDLIQIPSAYVGSYTRPGLRASSFPQVLIADVTGDVIFQVYLNLTFCNSY